MMMISDTYGTTFLGTGKLKQLMSLMSSLVGNRLHDDDFFTNISAETVCNEFRYTEFEKDLDFITEIVSAFVILHVNRKLKTLLESAVFKF